MIAEGGRMRPHATRAAALVVLACFAAGPRSHATAADAPAGQGASAAGTPAGQGTPAAGTTSQARPALVVAVGSPQRADLAERIVANGSVAPWQEASIGAEVGGLRLAELPVAVGDRVRQGQLIARLAAETVEADLAVAEAGAAQAQAALAQARADAERARAVRDSGALSAQQVSQYLSAETTAAAQLQAAQAQVLQQRLRLARTRVLAPDDGVISARPATLGSVVAPGQELLRMVLRERLEWRAELTAAELARIRIGQRVQLLAPSGDGVQGRVRMIAPTLDPRTRLGVVFVDLPAGARLRAGEFARGEFSVGASTALTVPPSAVVVRDGFHYVFELGADDRVTRRKVQPGRRAGDRIEIVAGLAADTRVVVSGAGFLNDGDRVRVVQAPAAVPAGVPAAPGASNGAPR
jgi:HlyD family secretion protein